MLVLTRQVLQRILIGDDIVITIVQVRGKHVQVGIKAPRDIPVRRDESEGIAEKRK